MKYLVINESQYPVKFFNKNLENKILLGKYGIQLDDYLEVILNSNDSFSSFYYDEVSGVYRKHDFIDTDSLASDMEDLIYKGKQKLEEQGKDKTQVLCAMIDVFTNMRPSLLISVLSRDLNYQVRYKPVNGTHASMTLEELGDVIEYHQITLYDETHTIYCRNVQLNVERRDT